MRSTGIFAAVGELLVKVLLKASVTNVDLLSSGKPKIYPVIASYNTTEFEKMLRIKRDRNIVNTFNMLELLKE